MMASYREAEDEKANEKMLEADSNLGRSSTSSEPIQM